MNKLADYLAYFTIIGFWFSGIAIASGFWQTLFTLFPPYGIYVTIEHLISLTK